MAQEAREPSGFELVHRNRCFYPARLIPDAEAHLRILGDVARDAQRLALVACVPGEELHELAPQRGSAPGTEAKPSLDPTPAMRAGVHEWSLPVRCR